MPPNSCWNAKAQCSIDIQWVLVGGTFRRCLGLKTGALMNGISVLKKKDPTELLSPFHHLRTQKKTRRDLFRHKTWPLVPWSQTSSHQNCEKYISVVYKPPNLRYFITAAGTWEQRTWSSVLKTLLEQLSEFNKIAGYKINVQNKTNKHNCLLKLSNS